MSDGCRHGVFAGRAEHDDLPARYAESVVFHTTYEFRP
ncbi:hypothetical protein BH23PLA1_BH23PLA1_08600 [soil metagenome]